MHLICPYGQEVKPPPFHGGVPSSILGRDTKIAVHILRKCKGVKDLVLGRRKTYTIKFYHWVSDVSNAPRKRIFVMIRFLRNRWKDNDEEQICLPLPPII